MAQIYIDEFLFVDISLSGKQKYYVQVLLEKACKSQKYVSLSKRELKPFPKNIMKTQSKDVHRVSGRLRASFHQFILCRLKMKPHPSASKWRFYFQWRFKLNKQLELNFTFDHVSFQQYFSSRTCSTVALELHNGGPNRHPLKYCGQLSNFSIYSHSRSLNQVLLRLQTYTHIQSKEFEFDVQGYFSIFDSKIMHTTKPPYQLDQISWFFQVDMIQLSKMYFVMYFIIRKLEHQTIVINPDKSLVNRLVVHDGPISSLSIIKPTNGVYETSTFQCMVMLIGEHNNFKICPKVSRWSRCKHRWDDKKFAQKINVKAKPIENVQEIAVDGRERQILQLSCHGNPNTKAVFVTTNTVDIQVNVTVQSLIYSGPSSSLCLFGGFAVTEPNTDNSVVHPSLCKSQDPSEGHQGKSFYSSKSALYLVLFSYNTLSTIDATVTMTSTRCRLIQICDCSYHHYCTRSAFPRPGKELCEKYLNERSMLNNSFMQFNNQAIVLSIPVDQCIVLQVVRNFSKIASLYAYQPLRHCPMKIYYQRYFKRKLLFSTRGSVNFLGTEEEYLLKCAPTRRKFHLVDNANVLFHGYFDSFCFPIDTNQSHCETFQVKKANNIKNLSKITNRFSDNSFLVAASTSSFLGSMYFSIWRSVLTNSWMEFILFNAEDLSIHEAQFNYLKYLSRKVSVMKVFDFPGIIFSFVPPDASKYTSSQILASSVCLHRGYMGKVHVSFVSQELVKKHQKQTYLSLPGQFDNLTILNKQKVSNLEATNETITISWLFGMYDKYKEILTAKTKPCHTHSSYSAELQCRNFSHLTLGEKTPTEFYFTLEHAMRFRFSPVVEGKHQSWVEANKLCEDHCGLLPKFTSIKQLQNILGILKLIQDVRPVEGIFVGLMYQPLEVILFCQFAMCGSSGQDKITCHIAE